MRAHNLDCGFVSQHDHPERVLKPRSFETLVGEERVIPADPGHCLPVIQLPFVSGSRTGGESSSMGAH